MDLDQDQDQDQYQDQGPAGTARPCAVLDRSEWLDSSRLPFVAQSHRCLGPPHQNRGLGSSHRGRGAGLRKCIATRASACGVEFSGTGLPGGGHRQE